MSIYDQLAEGRRWCQEELKKTLTEKRSEVEMQASIANMNIIVNSFWAVVEDMKAKGYFDANPEFKGILPKGQSCSG